MKPARWLSIALRGESGCGRTLAAVLTLGACAVFAPNPAFAQAAGGFSLTGAQVQKRANAVLAVMGYTVVPDVTTSSLSVESADTGNPGLVMTQLAGGFTLTQSFPLYLEGGLAASRYDPTFIASNGEEQRPIPVKWTSVMASGGIGWDFPLTSELKFRPIFNFALGHMESDASALARLIDRRTGTEIDFLEHGRLDAYGYGASLMLDYEDFLPEREIDVEWRLSAVRLESYNGSSSAVEGRADTLTSNLWARWRAPTGLTALDRPVRYVLEAGHSTFFGAQRDILGFEYLSSLGFGLEVDSSAHDIIITRTRLVARYRFGQNIHGWAAGFAVSF